MFRADRRAHRGPVEQRGGRHTRPRMGRGRSRQAAGIAAAAGSRPCMRPGHRGCVVERHFDSHQCARADGRKVACRGRQRIDEEREHPCLRADERIARGAWAISKPCASAVTRSWRPASISPECMQRNVVRCCVSSRARISCCSASLTWVTAPVARIVPKKTSSRSCWSIFPNQTIRSPRRFPQQVARFRPTILPPGAESNLTTRLPCLPRSRRPTLPSIGRRKPAV